MFLDEKIKAVAFDIDGTLYADWKLGLRILPDILKHCKFFWYYGKTRKVMHKTPPTPVFFEEQGKVLGEMMHCPPEKAAEIIRSVIYEGFQKYFKKIPAFPGVEELFAELKGKGYKVALLSDFDPGQKGEMWGLKKYCDAILGTENIGALKPSKVPFEFLSETLGVKTEEILYVGNSIKYDIIGAKNAGMKTALKIRPFSKKCSLADINFVNYKDLKKILLG